MTKRRPKPPQPSVRTETFHLPKRKRITPLRMALFLVMLAIVAVAFVGLRPTGDVFAARLTDIYGHSFSIADYRGEVVLLDFMASWCPSCKAETPHLIKVYQAYGGSIGMISISMWAEETDQTLGAFRASFPGAGWSFARDTARIWFTLGLTALPTLIILDKQGNIHWKSDAATGPIDETTLSSVISPLQ